MRYSAFVNKRPKAIRVMGRNYEIKYGEPEPTDGSPNVGLCYNYQLCIVVREGMHPVEEADTLLHEILHAIWYSMDIGRPRDEEFVVRKVATGLMQVILDNPGLTKYLEAARNF